MKMLVAGSSKMKQREWVAAKMTEVCDFLRPRVELVIQGGAPGVDTFAKLWAMENGIQPATYDALWKFHGRPAGPIRTRKMYEFSQPDLHLSFPGGRGTEFAWQMARQLALPRIRIDNDGNGLWFTGGTDIPEDSPLAQQQICA